MDSDPSFFHRTRYLFLELNVSRQFQKFSIMIDLAMFRPTISV